MPLQFYYKSGSSYTSVFTVVIPGVTVLLTAVTPPTYYGRVRSFDNSGNRGPWTSLIGSVATLIDSVEITELTASKIKAGTITSSVIALDGANSIIKSSGYEAGVGGWAIKGNGDAEFSAASIRGGLKAQSVFINADNRWRRNYLDTAANSEFKVGNGTDYLYYDGNTTLTFTGDLSAAGGTFSGRLQAGDIYVPNTASPKFKVDTNGNMTCVDAQIDGTLNGVDGTFSGRLQAGDIYIPNTTSPKFSVDGNGNMTCVDATINGTLGAVDGTFQGTLQAGDIYIPNTTSPKFQVDTNGNMTCSDANVTGILNAESGSRIGNFYFNQYGLTNGPFAGALGPMNLDTYNNIIYTPWLRASNGGDTVDIRMGWIQIDKYGDGTAPIYISRERNGSNKNYCAFALAGYEGGVIGTIRQNGSAAVAYNTTSDSRLKINLDKPYDALAITNSLIPRVYKMLLATEDEKDEEHLGFFAQELYEVYPEAVSVGVDAAEENIDLIKMEPWSIDYSRITPLLTKAIQELSAKVAVLESKMV